jgi:hypothetical protein
MARLISLIVAQTQSPALLRTLKNPGPTTGFEKRSGKLGPFFNVFDYAKNRSLFLKSLRFLTPSHLSLNFPTQNPHPTRLLKKE